MSEQVRDGRKGRFWMDDDVLDRYGAELGAYGIAVYTMLCRRADKNGASYPSLKRMAEDLGISERQAKRELKKLRDLGLISIENRQAKQLPSVYTVLELPGDSQSPALGTVSPPKEDTIEKEGVEANASSGMGKTPHSAEPLAERSGEAVIGLEKYVVDGIYEAMKEAGFRLPNEHYKYHLGRAKDTLEKDEPADEEIKALPAAFVGLWTIKGRADAHSALMELRRQRARPGLIRHDEPAPWEPVNPHSPKPPMDPEKLAKEKARREEVARMLASAVASAS